MARQGANEAEEDTTRTKGIRPAHAPRFPSVRALVACKRHMGENRACEQSKSGSNPSDQATSFASHSLAIATKIVLEQGRIGRAVHGRVRRMSKAADILRHTTAFGMQVLADEVAIALTIGPHAEQCKLRGLGLRLDCGLA